MKKFNLVGLMLIAVAAFLAVAVTSASAETEHLLWLVNGLDFTGTLSAETEGDLILVRLNGAAVVQNKILCEGILDGTITNVAGEEGSDEITKVLNLLQEEIAVDVTNNLAGLALECEVLEDPTAALTACTAGLIALVWPAGLPWLTLLELMTATLWLNRLFKDATDSVTEEPGYEIECVSLFGIVGSELCKGNTSAQALEELEVFLAGETILGSHMEFNYEAPISSEEGECGGTANVAALQGLGVTWAVEGELNRLETDVSETMP